MDDEPVLGAPPAPFDEDEDSFSFGAPPPPPPLDDTEDDSFLGAPPAPPTFNASEDEENLVLGAPPSAPVSSPSPVMSSKKPRPFLGGPRVEPINVMGLKAKPGAVKVPLSPDDSPRVDASPIFNRTGSRLLELKASPGSDFVFFPGSTNEEEVHAEFKIIERLGKGSSGTVYKAVHLSTGFVIALKKVAVEDQEDFVSEINFMQKCQSPHVVRYYGHYTYDDYLWILLQYCPVGSVADLMLILDRGLEEHQIAAICKGALLGLDDLHKARQVHRDIKPENILIAQGGTIKLADFGVASQMTTISNKKVSVVGTPYFMAPEVVMYTYTGYDSKADLWSLAISCIDMAQREPPRFEIPPSQVVWAIPHLPPPTLKVAQNYSNVFNHFLAYALVKDQNHRPTAEQLLQHPFMVDAKTAEEALAPLLEEAENIIAAAGGIEPAIKAAKRRIKERERQEFIQSQESESALIPAPVPETAPASSTYAGTLIPIEEEGKQKERKKRIIKGKIGRFLHRRPKPAEMSSRGLIQEDHINEEPEKTQKLSPTIKPEASPPISSRGTLPPASLMTPPLLANRNVQPLPVIDMEPTAHRKSFSSEQPATPHRKSFSSDKSPVTLKEKDKKEKDEDDAKKKKGITSLFGLRKRN